MRAALVTAFDRAPTCAEVPAPVPASETEVLVDVVAVGLHPRVRSQADGSHYTSTDQLPLVPGIDGVGRDPDGRLRYFILADTTMGAMAEQTVIDVRRSILLPPDADAISLAAAMNPAMSSWVALRRRIAMPTGARVLVLGATGNAGRLAIQVAKHLGASTVIAAGRGSDRLDALAQLGADQTVSLDGDPDQTAGRFGQVAGEVDVVLDYLWGQPAGDALVAIARHRVDRGQPLTWIEIGSVAGPTAAIPSAALRAVRLQIVGSGQGSVPTRDIVAELKDLAAEITQGTFDVAAVAVPLADVEQAWADRRSQQRIVVVP
jgi:NADPH:quinone reductase-like Zn-dependent oxidoreductase